MISQEVIKRVVVEQMCNNDSMIRAIVDYCPVLIWDYHDDGDQDSWPNCKKWLFEWDSISPQGTESSSMIDYGIKEDKLGIFNVILFFFLYS